MKRRNGKRGLSTTQIIMLSFLGLILLGSILLSLPFSTADGKPIAYMDALLKEIARAKSKGRNVSVAQSLLDARESVMAGKDQKILDEWRLAAGRTVDALRGNGKNKSK